MFTKYQFFGLLSVVACVLVGFGLFAPNAMTDDAKTDGTTSSDASTTAGEDAGASLASAKRPHRKPSLDKMFERVDADGDGSISKDEFKASIKKRIEKMRKFRKKRHHGSRHKSSVKRGRGGRAHGRPHPSPARVIHIHHHYYGGGPSAHQRHRCGQMKGHRPSRVDGYHRKGHGDGHRRKGHGDGYRRQGHGERGDRRHGRPDRDRPPKDATPASIEIQAFDEGFDEDPAYTALGEEFLADEPL